jgi:predicted nucleotidyltransferase
VDEASIATEIEIDIGIWVGVGTVEMTSSQLMMEGVAHRRTASATYTDQRCSAHRAGVCGSLIRNNGEQGADTDLARTQSSRRRIVTFHAPREGLGLLQVKSIGQPDHYARNRGGQRPALDARVLIALLRTRRYRLLLDSAA